MSDRLSYDFFDSVSELMSFLFGNDSQAPAPAAVPVDPSVSQAAAAQRQAAMDAATAEQAAAGRRSTMAAGTQIAGDAQSQAGLLSSKRRAAASLLG